MQKKELMNVNLSELINKTTSDGKDLGNHVRELMYTNIAHTDKVEKKHWKSSCGSVLEPLGERTVGLLQLSPSNVFTFKRQDNLN